MARATTKQTPDNRKATSVGSGRKPSAESQKRLDTILKMTEKKPGIESPEIAAKLDISTLTCSQLADRLIKSGDLAMVKLASGKRTYYLPSMKAEIKAAEKEVAAELKAKEKGEAPAAKKALTKPTSKPAAKKTPAKKAPASRSRKTKAEPASDLM